MYRLGGHNTRAGKDLKYTPAPGRERTHSVCRDCDNEISNRPRVVAAHNERCKTKRKPTGQHSLVYGKATRDGSSTS